jgi:CheY-like chemotaxis protein
MAKQKVFLVDDDSDILVLNRDFLESEGYDVVTATNCAEALEKIKLHSFSCIVLDVMLPDGSAFDLAPKIKEFTDCPIIFLTAKDQQEEKCDHRAGRVEGEGTDMTCSHALGHKGSTPDKCGQQRKNILPNAIYFHLTCSCMVFMIY